MTRPELRMTHQNAASGMRPSVEYTVTDGRHPTHFSVSWETLEAAEQCAADLSNHPWISNVRVIR